MAAESSILAISQLQNLDLTAQVAALRRFKNDLIGNPESKELFIRHGIIDATLQLLANAEKSRGKKKTQDATAPRFPFGPSAELSQEEDLRLQAIIIFGTLAIGGPACVPALVKGGVVPFLINGLSPTENSRHIVTAALRALRRMAESDRFADPNAERFAKSAAVDDLFSPSTVYLFSEILAQRSAQIEQQRQIELTCKVLNLTCQSEHQRNALLTGGVLDVLAAKLVAHYVMEFKPKSVHASVVATLPPAPQPDKTFTAILGLTATIVEHSKYRVHRLLYSPMVIIYLPFKSDPSPELYSNPLKYLNTLEAALPRVDVVHHREVRFSEAFPALGSVQPTNRSSGLTDMPDQPQTAPDDTNSAKSSESMMIPWLLYLINKEKGLGRIEAARLLVRIASTRPLGQHRERMVSLSVIPPLVELLGEPDRTTNLWADREPVPENWQILERAPAVLAEILEDPANPSLRTAASKAHVIEKIAEILKGSFEPLQPRPPKWTGTTEKTPLPASTSPSCSIGLPALRTDLVHITTCRESGLLLLAALASKEDEYRKQFTEPSGGVIPYVISSLLPWQDDVLTEWNQKAHANRKERLMPGNLGNDINVLLAACKAAQFLSRSVALLRTSLIDAGIAKPIYALLRNPNVSVLIAATDVVCNLTLEFSPMRKVFYSAPSQVTEKVSSARSEKEYMEIVFHAFGAEEGRGISRDSLVIFKANKKIIQDLIEAGAIRTLCEHAHSADSKIRLGALWALKHLVNESRNEIKKSCFEELGTGWLIQIISGGTSSSGNRSSDMSLGARASMGTANAAGERVDILNAVDEPMDTEDSNVSSSLPTTSDADVLSDRTIDVLSHLMTGPDNDAGMVAQILKTHRPQLLVIKQHEEILNALQAHKDEQLIQSQGLDFVRNLIQGPEAAEMIDTLFSTLGANRVFDIIASKLKVPISPSSQPVIASPNTESSANLAEISQSQATALAAALSTPATEVICSAVFILVHIAAGAPRHRQQLISQPALLRSLIPLLKHEDPKIRVSVVWTLNNLTWVDDDNDVEGARKRAMEIRLMGFEDALKEHVNDESLDMRERVAQAREQLGALLSSSSSDRSSRLAGGARATV